LDDALTFKLDRLRSSKLLIIDFEATCWGPKDCKPRPLPGCSYTGEIIEFGVVLYCPETRKVLREFQVFVRPIFHPRLTAFCRELTHISQTHVDRAETFPRVLEQFVKEFGLETGKNDLVFCSWGDYDRYQLQDDCRKHKCDYPFLEDNHVNLKSVIPNIMGLKRKSLQRMLDHLGMQFEGTPHRGIDDARNIARIVQTIL